VRNTMTPAELPFVGRENSNEPFSFWTVRAEGTYFEGVKVGASMASAYVAYLASGGGNPAILPQIAIDMLNVANVPDGLQGQVVGFFAALEVQLTRTRR